MMFFGKKDFDAKLLNELVMKTVTEIFEKMSKEKFSRQPVTKRRPIIVEGEDRMMASGFFKNFGRSYISSINYYLTQGHAQRHKPSGTLVVYVSQIVAEQLFKSMNLLTKSKVDDALLADLCGELCNMFAGDFKTKLVSAGYRDLLISSPVNFLDKSSEGVEFNFDLDFYQEFQFYLYNEKAIVVDVALTALPKAM